MNLKFVFVMVGVVALSAASFGQGRGPGMFGGGQPGGAAANPSFLMQREDVRADLKITDDQKAKLQDLQDGMRQQFMDAFQTAGQDQEARTKAMAGIMKKISEDMNKILTDAQQTRLKEIAIQITGSQAAAVPDIQKALGITDDQKAKIADLATRQQAANADLFAKVRSGDIQREDVLAMTQKNNKILNDEIDKILTATQKDKLKAMGGKPFVSTTPPPGGGGFLA